MTIFPLTPQAHVVVAGTEPWGHARPLCALAARIVHARPVYLTFFTSPRVYDRIRTEISRSFGPQDADRQKLVRVIALETSCPQAESGAEQIFAERTRYDAEFSAAYERLVQEGSLTCAVTGVEYPPLPAPKLVIADIISGEVIPTVRRESKIPVKVLCFYSSMGAYVHLSYAPVERGGVGDFRLKSEKEAERSGRPLLQVVDEVHRHFGDTVLHPPGLPPIYHWECDPQESLHVGKGILGQFRLLVCDNLANCDGLIIQSPQFYEPKAIVALKEWFGSTGRTAWSIGPLLPLATSEHAIAGERLLSENATLIKSFMDNVLETRGEHSLIYISFGSVYWPPRIEKLEAFVDVLLERSIPFILSHGARIAQIPDNFRKKVEASKLGILSPWSPQQTILNHPAIGWFVTHCGHNSVIEAVTSCVPLICWPLHSDQGPGAIHLTENHEVAYELIEIRTGNGLKPRYRTRDAPIGTLDAIRREAHDVLGKAFGEDGLKKRGNMKKLQEEFSRAWEEGGSTRREVEEFVEYFGL